MCECVQGLNFTLDFWEKVRVLKDVMEVRSEVFVVGPAGSGKSTLWRALARGGTSHKCAAVPRRARI